MSISIVHAAKVLTLCMLAPTASQAGSSFSFYYQSRSVTHSLDPKGGPSSPTRLSFFKQLHRF